MTDIKDMTREELLEEIRQKGAWSIESAEQARSQMKLLAEEVKGNRIYEYYTDDDGNYWYRTIIKTPGRLMTLEEKIFNK